MDSSSQNTFQVYSASAGAGKTFNLVKHYLSLCLKDSDASSFNRILAITFTVKAASEMKSRVIVGLDAFRQNPVPKKYQGMFNAIQQELGMDADTLRNRSNAVLRRMLHDYAGLGISTIDKFTYRLVRTFGYELGLSVNFDLQLDVKELYRESVDLLLDEYDHQSEVMGFIHGFIESQMEEGKNWRPETKMLEMAEHLGKEDSYEVLDKLKQLTLSDFKEIREELHERRRSILKKKSIIIEEGERLFGHIDKAHFSGGLVMGYLDKLRESDFSKWHPVATIIKQMNAGSFIKKGASAEADSLVTPITPQIVEWLNRAIQFADENVWQYALLAGILESFDSLAVLHEIARKLDEYKEVNNVETLSTFNKLIHESLSTLPAPYIYERIGEKYRHYFIDEFQDTSILQWKNLTPLVHNAISSGGTSMIVGDAKQSIYRWRGGKAEQFMELIQDAKQPESRQNPMYYALQHQNLEHNWRSRKQIVQFNNAFFSYFAKAFDSQIHQELYQESPQSPMGNDGGMVTLEFLELQKGKRKVVQDDMIAATIKRVEACLECGYELGDITILIRKKAPARSMARALAKKGFNVVSEDSLLLGNASSVKLIVACMRFIHYPADIENRIEMVDMMYQTGRIDQDPEVLHYSLQVAAASSVTDFRKWLEGRDIKLESAWVEASGLYEKGESIVRALGLMKEADPFVQFFLDELYEFGGRKGQSVHDFYEWWEEKRENLSISSPKTQDAIQILTIHKAKGLEFPVVIFPFVDFEFYARGNKIEKRWIQMEGEFGRLPAIELPMTKTMTNAIGPHFPKYTVAFEQYRRDAFFDNLNLMYVAMTRPVDQLHIIGAAGQMPKEEYSDVGELLREFVDVEGRSSEAGTITVFGDPNTKKEEHSNPQEQVRNFRSFYTAEWRDRVQLSRDTDGISDLLTEQPRRWGNLVHAILSDIQKKEDVSSTIEKYVRKGEISKKQSETLEQRILEIVEHPLLARSFTADEVMSERDWIGDGAIYRPDRVSKQGEQWTVIDYKTGESSNAHAKQVREYMNLLNAEQVQGFLVYINDEIEVVEVDAKPTSLLGGDQLRLL